MARVPRNMQPKKAIYVFWEGESEEAYVKFLSRHFSDRAVIRAHREKGTFATAQACYRGNARFKSDIEELDEVWFFFDTELEKGNQWDENWLRLKPLLEARSKHNPLKIRLLMTSCCVEYWFLLHFDQVAPAMASPSDKDRVLRMVQSHISSYRKGDAVSTAQIGQNYLTAIENGRWVLQRLKSDGMPEDVSQRDKWLFQGKHTFTTVHEAVDMLRTSPSFR